MKYLFPINAINRAGVVKLLYTPAEVREFRRGKKVGQYWTTFDTGFYIRFGRSIENDWILRDDRGRPVDDSVFDLPRVHWKDRKGKHEYRNGPVPHCGGHRGCWKMNHTAKKNSGAGHRNRNRAKAIYDAKEYGVKNNIGNRVIPWEHY